MKTLCFCFLFSWLAIGLDCCMRKEDLDKFQKVVTIDVNGDLTLTCPRDQRHYAKVRSTFARATWQVDDFRLTTRTHISVFEQTSPDAGGPVSVKRRKFPEGRTRVSYVIVDRDARQATCSFVVDVRVRRCRRLASAIPHGTVACGHGFVWGAGCFLSCRRGFRPLAERLTCRKNRRWSAAAECRLDTCPPLGVTNGTVVACSRSPFVVGSRCSFSCPKGLVLVGPRSLSCLPDGRNGSLLWSGGSLPVCRKLSAPRVKRCPGETVHVQSRSEIARVQRPPVEFVDEHDEPITPNCQYFGSDNQTFLALGVYSIHCTGVDERLGAATGRFASSCSFTLQVEPLPCRPMRAPSHGSVDCHGSFGGFTQKVCNVRCRSPYVLGGRSAQLATYRCGLDGRWTPSPHVARCVLPLRPKEVTMSVEFDFRRLSCADMFAFQYELVAGVRHEMRKSCPANVCSVQTNGEACSLGRDGRSKHVAKLTMATRVDANDVWPDSLHGSYRRLHVLTDALLDLFAKVDLGESSFVPGSLRQTKPEVHCPYALHLSNVTKLCAPCGAGSFFDGHECALCPKNTYQPNSGALHCTACPGATQTRRAGAVDAQSCRPRHRQSCRDRPCRNGGRCQQNDGHGDDDDGDGDDDFICHCPETFTGARCSLQVSAACRSSATCRHGGVCRLRGSRIDCHCGEGFIGASCQHAVARLDVSSLKSASSPKPASSINSASSPKSASSPNSANSPNSASSPKSASSPNSASSTMSESSRNSASSSNPGNDDSSSANDF